VNYLSARNKWQTMKRDLRDSSIFDVANVAEAFEAQLKAVQHRMHLTAFAAGGFGLLAGVVVGWLAFAC